MNDISELPYPVDEEAAAAETAAVLKAAAAREAKLNRAKSRTAAFTVTVTRLQALLNALGSTLQSQFRATLDLVFAERWALVSKYSSAMADMANALHASGSQLECIAGGKLERDLKAALQFPGGVMPYSPNNAACSVLDAFIWGTNHFRRMMQKVGDTHPSATLTGPLVDAAAEMFTTACDFKTEVNSITGRSAAC